MITRPLDLASKLRPEPRNFGVMFLVNGGLIVLFFYLFESRFVLAPGLGVDFQIPVVPGARSGAVQTTHRITVKPPGLIILEDGPADVERLGRWLKDEAKITKQPSLLVIVSTKVSQGLMTEIYIAAAAAGFTVQVAAEEPIAEKR
jgi:hypothetical protein